MLYNGAYFRKNNVESKHPQILILILRHFHITMKRYSTPDKLYFLTEIKNKVILESFVLFPCESIKCTYS